MTQAVEAAHVLYSPVPGADCMELEQDYCFEVAGLTIWIPKGYRWNGASIPQLLWGVIGGRFEPDRLLASMEHDWIYLCHCVTRKQADTLFNARLKEAGDPAWKRAAMYQAVRVFGGGSWPTSKEDRAQLDRVRALLALREDRDQFTRLMLVA